MKKLSLKNLFAQYNEECSEVLKQHSFDINMRMMKESPDYRKILDNIQSTMRKAFNREYADYDKLHGLSGPNIGIPLRIIAIRIRKENGDFIGGLPNHFIDNDKTDSILFMLNPAVTFKGGKIYEATSNCGSLLLEKPIKINRAEIITVTYFDFNGDAFKFKFRKPIAATIQHEIEHTQGITILDLQVKEADK